MGVAKDVETLRAQLGDNTTQQISAEDVQDVLESKGGVYGMALAANPSSSVTPVTLAFAKCASLWDSAGAVSGGVSIDTANQEIVVPVPGVYLFLASFTWRHATSGALVEFAAWLNGSQLFNTRYAATQQGTIAYSGGWISVPILVPSFNARLALAVREVSTTGSPSVSILKANRASLCVVRIR